MASHSANVPAASLHRARQIIRQLPALPSSIRYLDEYEDQWRSVRNPTGTDVWVIESDTRKFSVNFAIFHNQETITLAKAFASWLLHVSSPRTAVYTLDGLAACLSDKPDWCLAAISRPLADWEGYWAENYADAQVMKAHGAKLFLRFLCEMSLGDFRPGHIAFVRLLPYRWPTHYVGVTTGESILAADEEAKIIQFLDEAAQAAQSGAADPERLTRACLLCISYQHGLRPVQIARVELRDVRIYPVNDGGPMVHFVAYRAKKRSGRDKTPFVCKVKHEWAALFVEYVRLRNSGASWRSSSAASDQKLFPLDVATIIRLIGDTTEALNGVRRTATDLRHTAAQRMADAGASIEEVAHFLGHSHADTSLAYFEASPTQAAMLNKALAISPIYSQVARTLREKTIDMATLNSMAPDKQIGAVPHGVPIAGIGACDLGQSLCPSNPVLACYNCRKFLPVADEAVHREVLNKLRSVVRFFYDESRGDTQSPAYVQLQRTLEAIQGIFVKGDTP